MPQERDISGHVAVIGMDGRFPGAKNLKEFWANLVAGIDSTRELSEEELLAAGETRETINHPDYIRRCAFLDNTDKFDARFFGIAPRDAAVMDPQHRLFLEVAWGAFEDAGYDSSRVPGPVAIFAGSGMPYYGQYNVFTNKKLVEDIGEWLIRHTANDRNFLSTLASYKMDMKGPSMNVQTACSSALVATHMAVQSLLLGECDMAIAGGSTIVHPQRGYKFSEGEILSSDGHCRAFDHKSNGTVFGSGCGAIVLRRLQDAIDDGDPIDMVILGSAINNDGADKVGYLAPSVSGQMDAIAQAVEMAEVDPKTINYVEAHGTGTVIGDPIEVTALKEAYQLGDEGPPSCGLGSVKTNIGHLGEAAGVAGLIKVALAMRHGVLPASLHFTKPNPGLEIEGSPYYVVGERQTWERGEAPRRAAITSLGAGGTNAHMILEEPPPLLDRDELQAEEVLVLSAKSERALQRASTQLADFLDEHPEVALQDVAFTLREGRHEFPYRRTVFCSDHTGGAAALREELKKVRAASENEPRLAFMYPGGGAQYANMGRDLYESEPVYREAIDQLAEHASPILKRDIRELMYCAPESAEANGKALQAPSLSLPALFSTSYALSKLLLSWGFEPDAMIGHSMGEYVAACLAGVFTPEDGMALVIERGRLFEQVEEGGMLAVQLSEKDAKAYLGDELGFAAINAPELCVLSGSVAAIDAAQTRLEADEVSCTRVRIKVAAHSHLLDPVLPAFRSFCEGVEFKAPNERFVSNLSGQWAGDEVTTPDYWVRHLRESVRFKDGLKKIFEQGETVLLEIGPGRTLASVAQAQSEPGSGATVPVALPTLRHPKEQLADRAFLFSTLGKVWGAGCYVDWEACLGERLEANRVHLPTYPFEPDSYWIDPEKRSSDSIDLVKREDVADWFHVPTWTKVPVFVSDEQRDKPRQWLVFSDTLRAWGRIRSRLKGRIVSVRKGLAFSRMDSDVFEVNPTRTVDMEQLLSSLDMDPNTPIDIVYLWPLSMRRSKVVKVEPESIEEAAFYGLLSLLQAAGDSDWKLRLHVVTNGALSIDGESVEPEKALALGPVRVGARELGVDTRLIDWKYDPVWDLINEAPASQLFDELVCGGEERVVALRDGQRFVEGLSTTRVPATNKEGTWGSKPNGTYLITGGFGGIGQEVAMELVRQGKPTLVLLGRGTLPTPETWRDGAALAKLDSRSASRCRFAASLEDSGARVIVESVDLSDAEAVAKLVARHPKLDGVFHTAGVLEDGPLQTKTLEDAKKVLGAKAWGAVHLARCLDFEQLEFLVLFSSASSRLGLRGQVDYTSANAMLDALASDLHARGCTNVYSVNWGTWRDVGMAARITSDAPEERSGGQLFSAETHWVIGEHRIAGGSCVMPGTGFLNLLFSALQEAEPGAFEAKDLLFLRPFQIEDGETRALELDRAGAEFAFVSDANDSPHVTGSIERLADAPARTLDLAPIRQRTTKRAPLREGQLDQDFVDFGERWSNIESIAYGDNEALTTIRLPKRFSADLEDTVLHPAMLDMATGGAQILIDDFDQAKEFFVPFSYGSFRFYERFTSAIESHVRFRGRRGDTAEFDVTITDKAGRVLAEIDSFLMKRVDRASFGATTTHESHARTQEVDANLRALVSQGVTAREGMDVIGRVLAYRPGPQIFATPISMDDWIAHSDRIDQEMAEQIAPAFTLQDDRPREEPGTPLEAALLDLWSDILGVGGLGVLDDFFELGGQSLVAARMFVRIRKKFGVSLPLSALFEAPTIRALALVIDPTGTWGQDEADSSSEPSAETAAASPVSGYTAIVPIQPKGARPKFFCMPGMGGNPLGQRFLSERLGKDQPFYGLQARGVDGVQDPHSRVEDMAAEYIAAMKTVQPEGPYYIGGFSGGGVVAYEIAQQLTAKGEEVALLALLDAYNPLLPPGGRVYKARAHAARSRHFGAPHVMEFAKWRIWYPIQRSGVLNKITGTPDDAPASSFETEQKKLEQKMIMAWVGAEKKYKPKPYQGDAILFRSKWDLLHGRIDLKPERDNGWGELVKGDLKIVDVPGTHDSFLLEPNVQHVADALAKALRGEAVGAAARGKAHAPTQPDESPAHKRVAANEIEPINSLKLAGTRRTFTVV